MSRTVPSARPARGLLSVLACAILVACVDVDPGAPSLSHSAKANHFRIGEHRPETSEAATVGAIEGPVERGTPAFTRLVRDDDPDIVFKDEEGTGADRMMTPRLRAAIHRLDAKVRRQWPGVTLRVTEAWDELGEHGPASIHYEGRAADLTTSDVDSGKLERLALLAVDAGLDWVLREETHVHASVRR